MHGGWQIYAHMKQTTCRVKESGGEKNSTYQEMEGRRGERRRVGGELTLQHTGKMLFLLLHSHLAHNVKVD